MSVLVGAGLLLSAGAFVQMRAAARDAERALAERQIAQLHDGLKERIDSHVLLLHALLGPFSGPAPVTADRFAATARPMMPLFPSLQAVAWTERVRAADVPVLEAGMRTAGFTGFAVRNIAGPPPAAMEPDAPLFVNLMMEPGQSQIHGLGVNVASLPGRAEVLARACASGQMTAAEAVAPTEQAAAGRGDGPHSLILYLPVYRPGGVTDGVAGHCGALAGYLWAAFRIDRLLDETVSRVGPVRGDLCLFDRSAPGSGRVLAALIPGPAAAPPAGGCGTSGEPLHRDLDVGGRPWRLELDAPSTPLFDPADRAALAVLGMGILLTGALAGYTRREAVAKRLLETEARARAAMARALRESEERFRLALRHSGVAVFSLNRDLRYIWMYNPQTARPAEFYIGRTNAELWSAEDAAALDAVKRSVLDRGTGARTEVRLTVDGRIRVFDLVVEPLRDDAGAVTGVICAGIDITEGSQIRQALADAHAEAERANQAKTRFLAAASHDLRQPFQAMSLFHHILMEKLTEPKQVEVASKLGEALGAGNALLNALLDTSALEAGNVKPRPGVFPFQEVAGRLAIEIADQAAGKGLTLRTVATSAFVRSDPVLLERILRNLLVNALRYTERGRILLGCRRRGGDLVIEVWDTGPGIPPDQQPRIFEDFYRCGNDQRDSARGLGLGLSIVRRTAQILDHRIAVRSTVGKGTVFAVTVPMAGDRRAPPGPPADPRPESIASEAPA